MRTYFAMFQDISDYKNNKKRKINYFATVTLGRKQYMNDKFMIIIMIFLTQMAGLTKSILVCVGVCTQKYWTTSESSPLFNLDRQLVS